MQVYLLAAGFPFPLRVALQFDDWRSVDFDVRMRQ